MTRHQAIRLALATITLALIAACGGGELENPPPAQPAPLQPQVVNAHRAWGAHRGTDPALDRAAPYGARIEDFFGALNAANDLLVRPDGHIVAGDLSRNVSSNVTTLVRILP